jgi:hypothetical protein
MIPQVTAFMNFPASHKKIIRAYKHVDDIYSLLKTFNESDCYDASIDNDPERGINFLCINLRSDKFPLDDVALIAGDALHNLRSALDLMYYQIVLAGEGAPTQWTRFPICNTRDELVGRWGSSAVKQKQITAPMRDFIIDRVQPYEAGNFLLWALDHLNIIDKHELLVPVLKLVGLMNVRLEDEQGRSVGSTFYLMDESSRIRIRDADDRKVTIKNKGHASTAIFFGETTPIPNDAIVIALSRIAEEVSHTVEAFELLRC